MVRRGANNCSPAPHPPITLPRLRAELAELKQRGESGTDVMQLELTIAYLEEQLRNNGNR